MITTIDEIELKRYVRQLVLPEFNIKGQIKLKNAKVLVVGAGGLGSPILLYLSAAGVGTLGIIDPDQVDISNLQRQIIYDLDDLGLTKSSVAKAKLKKLNPYTNYITYTDLLRNDNALDIIQQYDLVIDGSDNFPTRYLVNDVCVFLKKPFIYGAIYQFEGQVSVFNHTNTDGSRSACYRCLYPNPPPENLVSNCSEGGVLGVLAGIIGSLQANEAIKLLASIGEPVVNRLFIFDSYSFKTTLIPFEKQENCPVCSSQPTIVELQDYTYFCTKDDSSNTPVKEISAKELKHAFDTQSDFQLIDVREPYEREVSSIGGDLIPLLEIENNINSVIRKITVDKKVVFYCRDGSRSKLAILLLEKEFGLQNLHNLRGGIQDWSLTIDPAVTFY